MSDMKLQDFVAEASAQFPSMTLISVEGPKPMEVGGVFRALFSLSTEASATVTKNLSDKKWSVLPRAQGIATSGVSFEFADLETAAASAAQSLRLRIEPVERLAEAISPRPKALTPMIEEVFSRWPKREWKISKWRSVNEFVIGTELASGPHFVVQAEELRWRVYCQTKVLPLVGTLDQAVSDLLNGPFFKLRNSDQEQLLDDDGRKVIEDVVKLCEEMVRP